MKYGFGIDLGGTTVKIAYFDQTGNLLEKWEIPTVTANNGQQILPDIAASIRSFLDAHSINETNILGLGIGVPGPVNAKGVVNKCVNLGWGVFNIAEKLSSLTGFPVKAGNDANVAALGEFWKGGGQGCDNMVFVTLGTGVGGGIVVEGHLLHGAHGSGAEIGHICVNPEETLICNCGNRGCVEQYCSATGIVRLAKLYLAENSTESSLRALETLTCKDIFDAAKAGDAAALAILDQVYRYMGLFLSSICSTVNPEVVVIGGGVSKAGDMLISGLEPYFHQHVFHAASGVKFAMASLSNDAGAYGAFKLALDAFGK
ncbi:MAG: ROK family glucokinase [Oscillospiraceae bacterium]|nr:ROK family glucokinase [Oscillospiraceae bacterium]